MSRQLLDFKKRVSQLAEIGWHEKQTTKYIEDTLKAPSLIQSDGCLTGAIFKLGNGKSKIFLRADIDALPTETGPKHLCGHHAHTAALMSTFLWLRKQEERLTQQNKQVLFIFQPAEETFPSGAKLLLQSHERLISDCIHGFGLHVEPKLPLGTIRMLSGPTCGAGDYIEINILGKSVHVKNTSSGIDAIEGAAEVVKAFKAFQSSFSNFGTSLVFNLNTIEGGTAANCTADNVKLTGDVRWVDKNDQRKIKEFCDSLKDKMKSRFKGDIVVKYHDGYPPVYNNPGLTEQITSYLQRHSSNKIISEDHVSLGIEDFAFYSQKIPCVFTDIGFGGTKGLHEKGFDVSDEGTIALFDYWKNLLRWWFSV